MNTRTGPEERRLVGLVSDESAALDVRHGLERARRLHRCQRGNVSILVLFMGLVFYAVVSLVWNTGEVTAAKIEAQTAADAAAYSSAVWTSRAVNLTTATNMFVLRDSTAAMAQFGAWANTLFPPLVYWPAYWARAVAKCAPLGPAAPACLVPFAALLIKEIAAWASFQAQVLPVILDVTSIPRIWDHIEDMHDYQDAWLAAAEDAIGKQEEALEDYFDCDILIRRGDGGALRPPLKPGDPTSIAVPLLARIYIDLLSKDSWYKSKEFTGFNPIGKAKRTWLITMVASGIFHLFYAGQNHHVLTTQRGPLEFGPAFPAPGGSWGEFSFVATARKRAVNANSAQPPSRPLRFMAPGLFADPVNPMAYAQAETFNGIDGHLSAGVGPFQPLQIVFSVLPWRVWTEWGWQWQPRLTHGSLLVPANFKVPDGPPVRLADPSLAERVATH